MTKTEDLPVIYEDNHLIVVLKQPNLLSQADHTQDDDMINLVKQYLKNKYQKQGNVFVGLVQRLDRRVGGLMVFAKTSKAAARMSALIRERSFQKEYLAIVQGKTPPLVRCCYIVKYYLVCTLLVVLFCTLYRVAYVTYSLEIDSLYYLAVTYVKTGDYSFRKHFQLSLFFFFYPF